MKHGWLVLLVFVLIVNTSLDAQDKVVAGYYTSWRVFTYKPADVPMDKVTHLLHAFVYPNASGDVNHPTYFFDPLPDLITLAHAAGVKVYVAVGGYNDSQYFSPVAANPAIRADFITNLTTFCTTHGYDGVDLDWEYPEDATDRTNLNLLVSEMKAYWTSQGLDLELSMAIPALDWNGQFIDVTTLAPHVEWFGIMTYDYYGGWSDNSGHNSPLYLDPADPLQAGSIDFSINDYYTAPVAEGGRGVSPDKLLCGIPFYGKVFSKTSEPYESYKSVVKTYRYDEIMDMSGYTVKWDAIAYASYLSQSSSFVTYSNETAVTEVCKYAKSKNLKGVMMWELSQAVLPDESQPLLEAIDAEMDEDPIAVEVVSFSAIEQDMAVEISWMTVSETDVAGYYIYGTSGGQEYQRCNGEMIKSRGGLYSQNYQYVDPKTSGFHTYKLEVVALDGTTQFFGPVSIIRSGVEKNQTSVDEFTLYPNYPNPFNPQTRIRYVLHNDNRTTIEIYNQQGVRVRTLVNEEQRAGEHEMIWDGRDDTGKEMSSGVYICRIRAGDAVQSLSMTLVK